MTQVLSLYNYLILIIIINAVNRDKKQLHDQLLPQIASHNEQYNSTQNYFDNDIYLLSKQKKYKILQVIFLNNI